MSQNFTTSWALEKYSRLEDDRNDPMTIEKSPADELVMKLNLQYKVISVYHNNEKMEEFIISPLSFAHDIIIKDVRMLFCVKNQNNGFVAEKFRVRFEHIELGQSFSDAISAFLTVQNFEEFNPKNSSTSALDMSFISNVKKSSSQNNNEVYSSSSTTDQECSAQQANNTSSVAALTEALFQQDQSSFTSVNDGVQHAVPTANQGHNITIKSIPITLSITIQNLVLPSNLRIVKDFALPPPPPVKQHRVESPMPKNIPAATKPRASAAGKLAAKKRRDAWNFVSYNTVREPCWRKKEGRQNQRYNLRGCKDEDDQQ